jgi:hypothetical protein
VSGNCGQSWTQIFTKSGTQLNTTGTLVPTAYLSPQASEWVTETINLASYTGNQNVYLKFEFIPFSSAPGNNLFVDDINISGTVGLKENINLLSNVLVYPNPTEGILNVELRMLNGEREQIQILNSLGQLLLEEPLTIQHSTFNIQHLPCGIYFVKISSDKGIRVVKVVKE